MTENKGVTHYDEDHDITCPVCGSNSWKLFKWAYVDEIYVGGFRVACANGCYVDNVNQVKKDETAYSVIKTAFGLIEDDRRAIK